jgi:hypothetical protein
MPELGFEFALRDFHNSSADHFFDTARHGCFSVRHRGIHARKESAAVEWQLHSSRAAARFMNTPRSIHRRN